MTTSATSLELVEEKPGSRRCISGVAAEMAANTPVPCFHCGVRCQRGTWQSGEHNFCCQGCLTVFELLAESGLGEFYRMEPSAGVRVGSLTDRAQFAFLDNEAVRHRLVDFANEQMTRVTFHLPAIHCIACVWLLENLGRLNAGIVRSEVNFPRKEVAVTFGNAEARLSDVAALIASLGYEPDLKLADLGGKSRDHSWHRLWLQLGIAGFAFGNIMLFSIAAYFGLDSFSGPAFRSLTGWLSLALALPVVCYSAVDYWRAAWRSVRQKTLTIDVPIAAGIVALFGRSVYEVASGQGGGYFDTLAGLIFFLLCGKLFQQKTFDRLSFDRDYRSFFPLSVTRKRGDVEEKAALAELVVGDNLLIRNGELIPADARLIGGTALIDYSFVTGESEPVEKKHGDYLYAGGRQVGGVIEVEITKAVSQSYLTSLWNQEAFRKDKGETLDTITNRYSHRFTWIILSIAIGAAAYWSFVDATRAIKAFTSVLIVACPCALALAAPFTLGTAQRVLARRKIFLKNASVTEALAQITAVVFDKTGTLTGKESGRVSFQGEPLTKSEGRSVYSVARQSTHPNAIRIGANLGEERNGEPVRSFRETPGCGVEGNAGGNEILLGSANWLAGRDVVVPNLAPASGSVVHLAINGQYRGLYSLNNQVRPETGRLIDELAADYNLALLSGDNENERGRFRQIFGSKPDLHFNQSPQNKLEYIHGLQQGGQKVLMVGDGLNDAGALQQSDAGLAVVESISAFSPASDVIMEAGAIPHLPAVLQFSKHAVRVVKGSFLISTLYNVVGISIAATGNLSPIFCAILMPLSSVSVVAFASGATAWLGRRAFESRRPPEGGV